MDRTWLKTIGEWHQKFYDWANDSKIPTWRGVLRAILYSVVNFCLMFAGVMGVLVLLLVLFGKWISGEEPDEILEND